MSWIEATYLHQRSTAEGARVAGRPLLRVRHSMQRESCWDLHEKVAMIDTCFQGWACPPIYIIMRTDLVDEVDDGEDLVFDGAHKLESVFEFINNRYPLRATAFSCREIKDNDGKHFRELSNELKNRVRQYKFCVNIVDEETANDPDRLRVLWERLNKAGRKLTSYELSIPIINLLIEHVLRPMQSVFSGSILFPKEESKRGELEQRLQVILALSDIDQPKPLSSQNGLVTRWQKEYMGETMAERAERIPAKAAGWCEALTRAHKMLVDLEQLNLFHDESGALTIQDAHRKTELPFVLGRLARRFPRIEDFRSQKMEIAARLKKDIFGKSSTDLSVELGGTGRNGTFQKKLLRYVDDMVSDLAGLVQPRLFTKAQKAAKLKEQGGCCTACGEKIHKYQLADGDHVVEWSQGGETTMENLQILHRHCHQAKGQTA